MEQTNKNEVRIVCPPGMEIDRENSTFECIKFKPIEQKRWRDDEKFIIKGFYITDTSGNIIETTYPRFNNKCNYNVFATEKQAKSALAMARISQIMANDERFGGVVTDEEWNDYSIAKYTIERCGRDIHKVWHDELYCFPAFHTKEQRDFFMKENMDLIKDYYML